MNISSLKSNFVSASPAFGKISWGTDKEKETTQNVFVSVLSANEDFDYKAVTFSDIQAQLGIIQKMPQNVIVNAENDEYTGEIYLYAKNENGEILSSYSSEPSYKMDINKFAEDVKTHYEEKKIDDVRVKKVKDIMDELSN